MILSEKSATFRDRAPSGNGKPWAICRSDLLLTARLSPIGDRPGIDDITLLTGGESALKARVRAAATDGEANKAVMQLVAHTLDVAPGEVTLIGGAKFGLKRHRVQCDDAVAAGVLERLAEAPAG